MHEPRPWPKGAPTIIDVVREFTKTLPKTCDYCGQPFRIAIRHDGAITDACCDRVRDLSELPKE